MSQCPAGQVCFNKEIFFLLVIVVTGIVVWFLIQHHENMGDYYSEKNNIKDMDNHFYLSRDKLDSASIIDNDVSQFSQSIDYKKNQSNQQHVPQQVTQQVTQQVIQARPQVVPQQVSQQMVHGAVIQPTPQQIPHQIPQYTTPLENLTNYTTPDMFNEPSRVRNHLGLPINIPTRGVNTQFSQIGILHNKNKKKGNIILPLFGKQLYPGSTKWQYYVTSDGVQSIKLDIKFKNRSGLNEFGCEEISDKDVVGVPSYRQPFVANIYNLEKPVYIPYV